MSKLAILLASAAALVGTAAPAVPAEAQARCGFYEEGADAYYLHCTNDGSVVQIKVDTKIGSWYECAAPWDRRYLGPASVVDNAYYTGKLC